MLPHTVWELKPFLPHLPADKQLIFIQGIAPIWVNKLKYYQDAEFQGLYD